MYKNETKEQVKKCAVEGGDKPAVGRVHTTNGEHHLKRNAI